MDKLSSRVQPLWLSHPVKVKRQEEFSRRQNKMTYETCYPNLGINEETKVTTSVNDNREKGNYDKTWSTFVNIMTTNV